MIQREKFDSNEKRLELFARDGWLCQVCGEPAMTYRAPQLAHRIAKTKANVRELGLKIIHHPLNMATVCSLRCNDAVSISRESLPGRELVERIRGDIERLT